MNEKGFIKIACDDGTIRVTEFYNNIDSNEFSEIFIDFVFRYIGGAFIYDDFSPCEVLFSYRDNTEEFHFESLEEMRQWYLFEI